jgi:urea transport system substrate-binding protein
VLASHTLDRGAATVPASWLLRGTSPNPFGPTVAGDAQSARHRSGRGPLRIVNFVGLSGSAGIWGPASINCTMLAVSEINRRGGILGREVEVEFRDAGRRTSDVVEDAADIVADGSADIIVGSHISAVRLELRKVIAGRIPYIYTPVYEGGERSHGVMAIGETPRRQTRPAIEWLAKTRRAARWYLIGSDYVWPWLSHKWTKRYIAAAGGQVVGEEFVALGEHDHSAAIARIRAAKPDVVMISLIGTDSVVFNRAFGECGLGAQMLRLCGAMDETILLGIGSENTENLFSASGYFVDLNSRDNDRFRADYQAAFGRNAPPVGSVAQSNYEGFRFLETIAARAQSLTPSALANVAANGAYCGARGTVNLQQGSASMPIYLSEADGLDFRLIQTF